jgi:hypothetical protein
VEIAINANCQIEPKGFWGTTIELKNKEQVLLKFKMNRNGEIVIQAFFSGIEKGYILKPRAFLNPVQIIICR